MTLSPTQELTRQAQAVQQLLAAYRDIIAGDEDFAADIIEGQTDFVEVVNVMVGKLRVNKALVAGISAHIKEMTARKARIEVQIERCRHALTAAFQTAGIKGSLRCPLGTVGLSVTPPKVIATNEALIPEEFWTQAEPELDKKALLAALKTKRKIPGAELSNGGVTISIRTT
jgi:hypothetical protein